MQKTICSIFFEPLTATRPFSKQPWQPDDRHRPGGFLSRFQIEACEPGQHRLLVVNDVFELQTNGSEQAFCTPVYGDLLARDIVNEWRDNKLFSIYGKPGIIICAGSEPTAEELATIHGWQVGWCKAIVNDAESQWVQGNRAGVTDLAKRAARWLGEMNYEWVRDNVQTSYVNCIFCQTRIDSRALICKECGKPQDMQRWLQHEMERIEAEAKLDEFKKKLTEQQLKIPVPVMPGQPKQQARP